MKRRKAFGDMRLQASQRVGVGIGIEKVRDGLEADGLAEPRRSTLFVDLDAGYGRHLNLPRAMGSDVEQKHAGESSDGGKQQRHDIADQSQRPAHVYFALARSMPSRMSLCAS